MYVSAGKKVDAVQVIKMISTQIIVRVRWAGATSQSFGVSNEVRQGSVLSPVFFNTHPRRSAK